MKMDRGTATALLCHNLPVWPQEGKLDVRHVAEAMRPYLSHPRSRVKEPVFHVSLNPHPKNRMDDFRLLEIAHYYMDRMGYGDQPYVIFRHNDTDRVHLHVVAGSIRPDGSQVDTSFYKKRSMAVTKEIEKTFGLIAAVAGEEEKTFEQLRKVEYQSGNLKHQLSSVVRNLMDRYDFCSKGEWNALLGLFNVSIEECVGRIKDRSYAGIFYAALDSQGQRVGKPIKASLIGKDVGYRALQRKYEASKKRFKHEPATLNAMRKVIHAAMQKGQTPEDFQSLIRPAGISVLFRRNEQNRIYGVTFFDHQHHLVLNGSRLGKEFSANYFQELFSGTKAPKQSDFPDSTSFLWEDVPEIDKTMFASVPLVDPLAELLDEAAQSDAYEEWMRLQKRKKKHYRHK